MRVRAFTQDDAHIFCVEEDIQKEVSICTDLLFDIYKDFGFNDIIIRLVDATRAACWVRRGVG